MRWTWSASATPRSRSGRSGATMPSVRRMAARRDNGQWRAEMAQLDKGALEAAARRALAHLIYLNQSEQNKNITYTIGDLTRALASPVERPALPLYDDTDQVMAGLAALVADDHATDNQRRIAYAA